MLGTWKMQSVYVVGSSVSSLFSTSADGEIAPLGEIWPKSNLANSPTQRVIASQSSPSKTSQCDLRNVDQLVVRLRVGAGSLQSVRNRLEQMVYPLSPRERKRHAPHRHDDDQDRSPCRQDCVDIEFLVHASAGQEFNHFRQPSVTPLTRLESPKSLRLGHRVRRLVRPSGSTE